MRVCENNIFINLHKILKILVMRSEDYQNVSQESRQLNWKLGNLVHKPRSPNLWPLRLAPAQDNISPSLHC